MNNRESLMEEVKEEYTNLIYDENQNHFHQTTSGITPESYYSDLYDKVVEQIKRGVFDNCRTGKEIVNKVKADKTLLKKKGK